MSDNNIFRCLGWIHHYSVVKPFWLFFILSSDTQHQQSAASLVLRLYTASYFFSGDCFHALKNRSLRPFHSWKVGHQCCFAVKLGTKTNNLHIRISHHFPSYILIASRDTSAQDPLLLLCCHRRLYQVLRKHFQNICASKLLKVSNLLQSRWKLKSCRVFIGGGEWCLSVWWIVAEGEGGWLAAWRGTDTRQILLRTRW